MRSRAPGPKWMRVGKLKECSVSLSSDDLEVALQLPVGDGLLGLTPFPVPGLDEMVHELFTEQFPRQLRPLQLFGRFLQGSRQTHGFFRLVRAAGDRIIAQLEALGDARHAGGDR